MQLINTLLGGFSVGMIYAAFALALVLIWQSTRIVNFAQAPMAMITTFIALKVIESGASYWIGFIVALMAGLVLGALVERLVVRYVDHDNHINPVILTLGLFIVLHALAAIVFGSSFRSFPAAFDLTGVKVGGETLALTPFSIFTILVVVAVMAALRLLFMKTDLGLTMRATAFNREVASVLGVKVNRALTLGWALAALVGSLSGLLIAGGGLVHPAYMDGVVVYGFVAAVLGGLDSAAGAVVGGLVMGIVLALVSGYLGSGLVPLAALIVLVVVLLVRPGGLFSTTKERTV
ncbi:branched-chain amino acid ABC transporter permease [Janibacter limosus]|uniref:Branched-chain amino acid ABC transporter permease n=1 Tax=Janibacter limosus TaxID=53458 RepID=A0A4P6MUC0_9MICO|nr:branched-chain amino acid ABC transporter permease [Janibacter limosus]QBF46506.1 branched-chain amino acid ABC transporter permease [Janibacter limosus]